MKKAAVCGIIVNGKILLLKRPENDYIKGYTLPGGKFDDIIDKAIEDCAIRELYEETNIKENYIYYVSDLISNNGKYIISIFYKRLLYFPEVVISSEHTDYLWVDINNLDPEILAGNTMQLINEIKTKYYYNEN